MDPRQVITTTTESAKDPLASPSVVGLPWWKRALDFTVIVVTSPVWLPLMLVIALVIRCVSRGPALFRQERIGYRGCPFTCFKFRTMVVNADAGVHRGYFNQLMDSNVPMKKLDAAGDSRVIPCGRLLRASGLDELPQLFNVLRGDMSLVGPRPCLPYEYANYQARHRQRLEAVPGLTGLWQVSGKNRTTFEEMINLDIHYARNKSLWMDVRIICLTLPAIVAHTKDLKPKNRTVSETSGTVFPDASLVNNARVRMKTISRQLKPSVDQE